MRTADAKNAVLIWEPDVLVAEDLKQIVTSSSGAQVDVHRSFREFKDAWTKLQTLVGCVILPANAAAGEALDLVVQIGASSVQVVLTGGTEGSTITGLPFSYVALSKPFTEEMVAAVLPDFGSSI
ncbi:MAG: hypothetical protein AAFQ51_06425 [Pseudomonadota bacterium]